VGLPEAVDLIVRSDAFPNAEWHALPGWGEARIRRLLSLCAERGVEIKWFGDPEPRAYTSRHESWKFVGESRELPETRRVLDTLCDMRVPLTFERADCDAIVRIVAQIVEQLAEDA